jgi:hypothetical protein
MKPPPRQLNAQATARDGDLEEEGMKKRNLFQAVAELSETSQEHDEHIQMIVDHIRLMKESLDVARVPWKKEWRNLPS